LTIRQARNRIARLKQEIRKDMRSGAQRALNASEREAKRKSSGPLTLATLARLDHPYAKRHGPLGKVSLMPGKSRSTVNVQTGAFRADWLAGIAGFQGASIHGRLVNYNPVADYLVNGTEFMVRRPIDVYMTDFLHNAALKELQVSASRLERYYS